ncbi:MULTISPECIES: hypothetical protein [unclassified Nocardia]|uniref:SCO6745 family protein n=1 Tax=unclassified Nocardia TaxID=2637762 RepID=UPI001CE43B3A|nr:MULTISPECIES: hypothetical protein [unclassified Nocardia]
MAIHPARRIWTTLEPLHDVVYFGAGVKESGLALGLRGYWQTYFAYRAAPLGEVGAGVVLATFAGFHPDMVAKALPDVWSRTTPQHCLEARLALSTRVLRECGAGDAESARAAALLAPALRAADATGRALYAANAALRLPDDPVGALWQTVTSLREHRGDGHVAALVAHGITGRQALVLQVAAGKTTESVTRTARGISEREWADAVDELRAGGLVKGEPTNPSLTASGGELLERVEKATDEAAWHGALSALSQDAIAEFTTAFAPLVKRVRAEVVPSNTPIAMGKNEG